MPANRFYFPHSLKEGESITLSKKEFHHAKRVMRLQEGDPVRIVNGMGEEARGIANASTIQLKEVKTEPYVPTYHIAQAFTIPNKLELIAEKLTELDVDILYFFPAELSEKKELNEHQKERLHKIIIQALKQCGRLFLPKLYFLSSLKELPSAHQYCFGQWDPPSMSQKRNTRARVPCFVNGPEKGLTAKERQFLRENKGAKGICLSKNVLRTETAAIAAGVYLSKINLQASI